MTPSRTGASRPDDRRQVTDWRRDPDLSSTSLGSIAAWSEALQSAAGLVFAARHPMLLFWGPDLLCLMNEAARTLRGTDQPLASLPQEAWPECWSRLQDDVRAVMAGAPAIWHEDWALPVRRAGRGADIGFSLTCSPVPDLAARSGIGGVLALLVENTPGVLAPGATLRRAQRMASLGQLTSNVAHDFNNLLGVMVGSFELIRRKHDDAPRVRELADAGLRVAERGVKLTSQLLAFSRAQRIELVPVSVAAVVLGMADMLRHTLGPHIAVAFDVRCEDRFVLSDPTQLEMAVMNLAINARDAMLDGGQLTVTAGLRTVEPDAALAPGEYVELMVQDTGVGMSQAVAARAFDPFFTTKAAGKGTGLGLSQVYDLARHAGSVSLESRLGHGTTIRMLLPCTDAPRDPEPQPHGPPELRAAPDALILLVDDDQDLRSVVALSLQDLGYRVIEAADGAAGLALLEQQRPDLLVADLAMPGMTGVELARSARGLHPGLPIIFASGNADTLPLDHAAGPAPHLLRKPFRISELQAEIEDALGSRS